MRYTIENDEDEVIDVGAEGSGDLLKCEDAGMSESQLGQCLAMLMVFYQFIKPIVFLVS